LEHIINDIEKTSTIPHLDLEDSDLLVLGHTIDYHEGYSCPCLQDIIEHYIKDLMHCRVELRRVQSAITAEFMQDAASSSPSSPYSSPPLSPHHHHHSSPVQVSSPNRIVQSLHALTSNQAQSPVQPQHTARRSPSPPSRKTAPPKIFPLLSLDFSKYTPPSHSRPQRRNNATPLMSIDFSNYRPPPHVAFTTLHQRLLHAPFYSYLMNILQNILNTIVQLTASLLQQFGFRTI
jgi:hypothetical protein